jgi:hypothetical protein
VMPVTVNTALTEGVADTRGVKKVEPEEVAEAIVDALETNRVDVYIPRSLRVTVALGAILPRAVREGMSRLMGVDKILTEVDPSSRRAYEERAAKSRSADAEPEVEPAQKDAA